MRHLIVTAHPNSESFSISMAKELNRHLIAEGHEVRLRNLYETGFDPALSASDFQTIAGGQMPADIKAEQEHILWSDHIIFIFPVWWGGMPAVLKGYVDRVFAEGFAYRYTDTGGEGLLAPRTGSTVCATGEPYEQGGKMHQAMNLIFESTIFGYSGIKPCKRLFYGEVPTVSQETRQSYIENAKKEFTSLI